jgi:hypothetical protein
MSGPIIILLRVCKVVRQFACYGQPVNAASYIKRWCLTRVSPNGFDDPVRDDALLVSTKIYREFVDREIRSELPFAAFTIVSQVSQECCQSKRCDDSLCDDGPEGSQCPSSRHLLADCVSALTFLVLHLTTIDAPSSRIANQSSSAAR